VTASNSTAPFFRTTSGGRWPAFAYTILRSVMSTRVFVDGTYAGVVDDFNGHFQHLDLTPGGHRIDVRQPGFQPLTFQVYIQPGHTTDYKAALEPAPGA
jgi:hypothetical protein